MKVNVIGTSCTWFKRKNTSYLIDDKIVFDVPNGAYKDIINLTTIEKISSILISHMHSDHFADFRVFALIFKNDLKSLEKKKMIYAPKGAIETVVELNRLMCGRADELVVEDYLKTMTFVDLCDGLEFEIDDYKVTSYKMEHAIHETYGFTFEDKNGKVVGFSSDTSMCDNLHKILQKSDYAFIEMAAVKESNAHLSINQVEELIKKYPNCKIFPVHTSDKTQKYAEDNNMNYLHDGQILNF